MQKNTEYRTVTSGVSPFWANKYACDAQKNWDAFYKRNGTNFFRDRHWTTQRRSDGFLALSSSSVCGGVVDQQEQGKGKGRVRRKRKTLLEAGCGVGNSIWPILEEQAAAAAAAVAEGEEECQKLEQHADTDTTSDTGNNIIINNNGKNDTSDNDENGDENEKDIATSTQQHDDYEIYAFDMSVTAIDLLRQHPLYSSARMNNTLHVFVWDISSSSFPSCTSSLSLPPTGFDIVSCIFMLSSVPPTRHITVVSRLAQLVHRINGSLLFRDYACGDLAQQRFKTRNRIEDNYFVRQDGTLSFFFDEQYIVELMQKVGLREKYVRRVERVIENRKEGKCMNRVFIQGEFVHENDGEERHEEDVEEEEEEDQGGVETMLPSNKID